MFFDHFRFKTIQKWKLISIPIDSKVTFSFYWILRMVLCHHPQKSIRISDLRMLFYHFCFISIQKWNLITIPIDSNVTFSFSWILRMVFCHLSSKRHSYLLFTYALCSFTQNNVTNMENNYNSNRF
jgi:hypothetical protein